MATDNYTMLGLIDGGQYNFESPIYLLPDTTEGSRDFWEWEHGRRIELCYRIFLFSKTWYRNMMELITWFRNDNRNAYNSSAVQNARMTGNAELLWNIRNYEQIYLDGLLIYRFLKDVESGMRSRQDIVKKDKEIPSGYKANEYQDYVAYDFGFFNKDIVGAPSAAHEIKRPEDVIKYAGDALSKAKVLTVEFDKLMEETKQSLGIGFYDKEMDIQINRYLNESRVAIDTLMGEKLDYSFNNFGQRELLINRVRYAWNNSLEDFNLNFAPLILQMQLLVASNKIGDDNNDTKQE